MQYYLSMDNAGSWHRVFVNLLHEAVEAENYQEASVFRDYTTRMESVDLLGEALDVRAAHADPDQPLQCLSCLRWCCTCRLHMSI